MPGDDPRFAPPDPSAGAEELELADAPRPPRRAVRDAPYRPAGARQAASERPAIMAPDARVVLAGGALAVLLAPLAALLPARWRERLGLERVPLRFGAFVISLAQISIAVAWFLWQVHAVNESLVRPHGGQLLDYIGRGTDEGRFALTATGMATWIYVALSWPGAACFYLTVEAFVRLAAIGAGEPTVPSGPLVLLDRAGRFLRRRWADRHLPPLAVDQVQRSADGGQLDIASCRARAWPVGLVLLVDGEAWRLAALAARDDRARPFGYRFEPAPPGQRGQRVYRPDELLG